MNWARIVLASGVIMLVAGFGTGSQPRSASVNDLSYGCGTAIPASWLVSGTESGTTGQGRPVSAETRRVEAACDAVISGARVLMWVLLGAGGLLTVVGWTALSERGRRTTARPTPALA